MWVQFNENPCGRHVGDCAVRAISVALGIDWETAYMMLCNNGLLVCDMPSSNATISATLRQHGFRRKAIDDTCPDCYTAEDFCADHPEGLFVLFFDGHVATIIDGNVWDSWDSLREIPQFYFYREEGE